MSKFVEDVTSIYWWLTVVVVGIVIHIAGSYLKPQIDKWLIAWSEKYRSRSAQRRAAYDEHVAKLRSDPTELFLAVAREIRLRLRFLSNLLISALMFLLALMQHTVPSTVLNWPFTFDVTVATRVADVACMLLGTLALFIGFLYFRSAVEEASAIHDAWRPQSSPEEAPNS
jgi:hypothetical protein